MSKNYEVTVKWHTPADPTVRETVVKTWASSPKLAEKIGLRGARLDGTLPADAIIDPAFPGTAMDKIDVVLADAEEERESDEVAEASAEPITNPSDGEGDMPDIFPPGTRVIVQVTARKLRTGAVDYRVDATSCRVKFDGPQPSELFRYNQLSLDDGSEPLPDEKAPRKPRAAPSVDRKPSKSTVLDAQAATGAMPTKPIITSPANREQYQKRFDQLEKWAMADDWDAIRGYEVKGINSYAKMVAAYRDRLLTAHAAQQRPTEGEAA
jgi:hypothetical protein